jgi:hypothetical protein
MMILREKYLCIQVTMDKFTTNGPAIRGDDFSNICFISKVKAQHKGHLVIYIGDTLTLMMRKQLVIFLRTWIQHHLLYLAYVLYKSN